jgi:hypothetical protein
MESVLEARAVARDVIWAMCPNSALHARPVPSSTKLTCRDKFSDNVSSVHQVDFYLLQESPIPRVDCPLTRQRCHRLLADGRLLHSLCALPRLRFLAPCPRTARCTPALSPASPSPPGNQRLRFSCIKDEGLKVRGLLFMEYCSGFGVQGLRFRVLVWVRVWVLGLGFWILSFGFWILGFGVWVLVFFWFLVFGFGFWVSGFGA